jgi:hypothetical protein
VSVKPRLSAKRSSEMDGNRGCTGIKERVCADETFS